MRLDILIIGRGGIFAIYPRLLNCEGSPHIEFAGEDASVCSCREAKLTDNS